MSLPTGKRGGQRLEFKAAEALGDPRSLAREVTAMLNAKGGDVWIGVPEAQGVALAPTPILDAERRRLALQDQLLDLIEPTPRDDEVEVRLVEVPGGDVIVVRAGRPGPGRTPFAWRSKGLFGLARRHDHRTVPLTMQDVRTAMCSVPSVDVQDPPGTILDELKDGRSMIAFSPEASGQGVREFDELTKRGWRDWHANLPRGGSLLLGRRFVDSLRRSAKSHELLAQEEGGRAERGRQIRVRPSGDLSYSVETAMLTYQPQEPANIDKPVTMHPYHLIGWIRASVLIAAWTAHALQLDAEDTMRADIRMRGLLDVTWLPYSPRSTEWTYWGVPELEPATLDTEVRLSVPARTKIDRLLASPDAFAVTLIERLYEEIDLGGSFVPNEVDREGRAFRDL